MAIDFRLLICLVGSFAFVCIYNAMILMKVPVFFVTYSAIMVFWLAGSYVALNNTLTRCFFLVGLSLCLPMISHPVAYLPDFLISSVETLDVSSSSGVILNRIQIRSFIVSLVGFLLLAEVLWFIGKRSHKELLKATAFIITLMVVVLSHSYEGYSVGQVILDLGQLAGALAIRCFLKEGSLDLVTDKRCWSMLSTIFALLALILAIDILTSLTGAVSWSRSYRGGLQGVFYAFEAPFAWALGSCLAFNLARFGRLNVLFWVALGLGGVLLFMTNIKTAGAALVLSLCVLPIFQKKLVSRLATPFVFILLAFFLSVSAEIPGSLSVRVGTYLAYGSLFPYDLNWLVGYKPGVTEFVSQSNLAMHFISLDYPSKLVALSADMNSELLERAGYADGAGAFLPHNVLVAMVASYGIVLIAPAFYYFILSPIRIFYRMGDLDRRHFIFFSVLIYWVTFSHLHPIIILAPIVLVSELILRKLERANKKDIK